MGGANVVDITHSERVEKDLDAVISKREKARVKDEGERLYRR